MTTPDSWIGTRWEARCSLRLPKGGVSLGDTFTFDEACAGQGLDPLFWIACGNAVLLEDAPSMSESVDRRAGKRRGWKFDDDLPVTVADHEPAADASEVAE